MFWSVQGLGRSVVGAAALLAAILTVGHAQPTTQPAARSLSPAEVDAVLDHLEACLADVKTISMDFEQEKHLSVFSDVVKSKGICRFVRPDAVRFEITEPFGSVLIARQRSVAKYEKMSDGWHKLDIEGADMILTVTGQIAVWLEGKFRAQKDIYDIAATESDHLTIVLTPRSREMKKQIQSVELDLSEPQRDRVTRVTIREAGGDYTQIDFLNEQRNGAIDPRLFATDGDAPTPLPAQK